MRKSVLLATVLTFACADLAMATPVSVGSVGKSVLSESADAFTPVRAKKRRVRKAQTAAPPPAVEAAPPAAVAPSRAVAPRTSAPAVSPPVPDAPALRPPPPSPRL